MLAHFVINYIYVFCFNCTKLHLNTYNIIRVSINKKNNNNTLYVKTVII